MLLMSTHNLCFHDEIRKTKFFVEKKKKKEEKKHATWSNA